MIFIWRFKYYLFFFQKMTLPRQEEAPEKRTSKRIIKEREEPPEKRTVPKNVDKEREEPSEKRTVPKNVGKEREEPPEKRMKATASNTASNDVEGI